MRTFEELIEEAEAADVAGWGFDWLDGRATEERPPWGYSGLLAERMAHAGSALDLDTGGGEVLDLAPVLPPRTAATEAWPPNVERARERLGPRGVRVVETGEGPLPFPGGSYELVTSRHPVRPDWPEIHRVLAPGGSYLAQHVGPASAFELIEHFLGPLPRERRARDPEDEAAAARRAGLRVEELRTARCRMEFFDVGAVVWILRKCVWWVPGFSAARYAGRLRELDRQMRAGRPFVAHSTRHLVLARKPASAD
ncbi:class I SAM-dependent methyltransferase [Rothia sp. AR01]|uniref:Class I SAM-dependent methyltransferase n=1 Tax=Rothia santali TaxID=2949643 RepID=A0A9X2KHM2_9MICC|nr:class I SAM-dependent methyltransferase [Rothia santali]MCP3425992.1 class I SAM-dependent methyltransferase [Rothia santali]